MNATTAVLLAAGRGTRMGSGTEERPKCLTPLLGRPLLEWQLRALEYAGIDDVILIGGYRASDLDPFGLPVRVNRNWSDTQMVATLRQAGDVLRDRPVVVSYADVVTHPDHLSRLARHDTDLAITVDTAWWSLWSARMEDPLEDAETLKTENGAIVEIGGKPGSRDEVDAQFMGLLRTTPAGWERIAAVLDGMDPAVADRVDVTELLSLAIDSGVRVEAVPVQGGWVEIDTLADRDIAEAAASAGDWSHDWRAEGDR